MEVIKAGCFLVNIEKKSIAIVYRAKPKDFTFPKGHLEAGETLEQCAIRETAEETKRIAEIVTSIEPNVEKYILTTGEDCTCYMYVAIDRGASDNTSEDTHDTYWIPFDEVEDKLSYPSLKNVWRSVKGKIAPLLA